jgi:hypothetical protein
VWCCGRGGVLEKFDLVLDFGLDEDETVVCEDVLVWVRG